MIDYFITSIVVLLMGVALTLFPPKKKINKYGYRTKAAMSSQENWDLAQKLAGRFLIINGVAVMLIAVLLQAFWPSENSRLAAVVIPLVGVFIVVRLVENRLKKRIENSN